MPSPEAIQQFCESQGPSAYWKSPKGRQKIVIALLNPMQNRLDYINAHLFLEFHEFRLSEQLNVQELFDQSIELLTDMNSVLQRIPLWEYTSQPVQQLKAIYANAEENLSSLIQRGAQVPLEEVSESLGVSYEPMPLLDILLGDTLTCFE